MDIICINSFEDLIDRRPTSIYYVGNIEPCIIQMTFHDDDEYYLIVYGNKKLTNNQIQQDLINNLEYFSHLRTMEITTDYIIFDAPPNLLLLYLNLAPLDTSQKETDMYGMLEDFSNLGIDIYVALCEHTINEYVHYRTENYVNKCNMCNMRSINDQDQDQDL